MQLRIELIYKKKGIEATFHSDELQAKAALKLAKHLEKTGRMKQLTFIDRHEGTWNMNQLKKYLEQVKTEPHDITVCFDGGFDRYPRKSGLGCAIYYEQNEKIYRMRKNVLVEGLVSNNEAEYAKEGGALYFSN